MPPCRGAGAPSLRENHRMPHIPAASALKNLRIIDLTRVRAGPTCVKQFADFGADVIKVESPEPDGMSGARTASTCRTCIATSAR